MLRGIWYTLSQQPALTASPVLFWWYTWHVLVLALRVLGQLKVVLCIELLIAGFVLVGLTSARKEDGGACVRCPSGLVLSVARSARVGVVL